MKALVRDAFTNEAHDVRVLRTQAGLLPEYRRFNTGFRHLFWECVFHYISRGFPETYFFASAVSPIPYALVCRHLAQVYPQPDRPTPARSSPRGNYRAFSSFGFFLPCVTTTNRSAGMSLMT